MAIFLTCTCGARLEIDDKYAGQVIACPDCEKPLNTAEPAGPPNLPVSGLALASVLLALVGAFTIVGTLAAVVVGYLAVQQIARTPQKIGGLHFARAGMILGGVFTLVTLAALASGQTLGVDALLREFRHASEVDYRAEAGGMIKISQRDGDLGIERPSPAWGKLTPPRSPNDLLTLVNLGEDAHLVILVYPAGENLESANDKAAARFRKSDLFENLNKRSSAADPSELLEAKPAPGSAKDQIVDVRLGGYERTFLLRVVKVDADLYLLAGGARTGRFGRVVDALRRSFDSFKPWKD